ncbi:MAG TPA: MBG domain-containing protein, partial [Baekduia sp.]|nr:MBG domain-containing protein [Baekduia sp.]
MLAFVVVAPAARADVFDPADWAPSVWSDKADYAPGATVKLAGGGWLPGEAVHIRVNDDAGSSWNRDADVSADDAGAIADTFNLPNWFVAEYTVTATGVSGAVARTTFTDGNVGFLLATDSTGITGGTVTWTRYNSGSNCTTNPRPVGPTAIPGSAGVGQDGVKTNVVTPPPGYTFAGWSDTPGGTSLSSSLCVAGGTNPDIYAHYRPTSVSTNLATAAASGIYGGTANLSATLTAGSSGVSGKTVSFTLNGNAVCGASTSVTCPTTNSSGVASLSAATLAGINAGTYPSGAGSGVRASFAGDATHATSSAGNTLTVSKKNLSVTADAKSKTYGGADPTLTYNLTSGSLETGDSFTGALDRATGESVAGSPYAIRRNTLTAGSNYDLTFIAANFTIT